MRLNKYNELYTEYLKLLVELHNANLDYQRRQNKVTTKRLRKVLKQLTDSLRPMRDEIQDIQKEKNEAERIKWAEQLKQKGKL
jgi:hypothetical protein